MGKNLHNRLTQLGGESFYDLGCADEATGLEDVVEPWVVGLWEALERKHRSFLKEEQEEVKTENSSRTESVAEMFLQGSGDSSSSVERSLSFLMELSPSPIPVASIESLLVSVDHALELLSSSSSTSDYTDLDTPPETKRLPRIKSVESLTT